MKPGKHQRRQDLYWAQDYLTFPLVSSSVRSKFTILQLDYQLEISIYLFIYLFAMFIQAIQFSDAGLNGGL